jgi:rfaE bifunctional protein nucleotidyltransferase chain/domain
VLTADEATRLQALAVDPASVEEAARTLERALRAGAKVLLFGNGGSAADAQHVAAELVGRFERDRPALPAVALTTDSSTLTAIANDLGFERVFERQIEALGRPGDVAVAISTSGSSPNVVNGVRAARRAGIATVGLCGPAGSELDAIVDVPVVVAAERRAVVQEAHLAIEHILCRLVETLLFDESSPRGRELPHAGRVIDLADLLSLRERWRRHGASVVWTNGCFDVLHVGHLRTLESARSLGDVLVVGVNDDAAVTELKGPERPIVPAAERAELVAALRPVDYVVVFSGSTPTEVLEQVQPDVHCKGEDYAPPDGKPIPERDVVERYGGRVEFLPLFRPHSTSDLLERIRSAS